MNDMRYCLSKRMVHLEPTPPPLDTGSVDVYNIIGVTEDGRSVSEQYDGRLEVAASRLLAWYNKGEAGREFLYPWHKPLVFGLIHGISASRSQRFNLDDAAQVKSLRRLAGIS